MEKKTRGRKEPPSLEIRSFGIDDYDRVMEIWSAGELPLKPLGRDSRENVARQVCLPNVRFLVAEEAKSGRVIGTVLATHDGRKGWINRLAVDAAVRNRGNLDPKTSEVMWELFLRLQAERKLTFVIATHNHELARRADHGYRLVEGRAVPWP